MPASLFASVLSLFAALTASADNEPTINLQRTGCYGTCPIYSVSIDPQGAVHFNGERFVEFGGARTGAIARAQYELVARAAQMLATLQDDYLPDHGCERYMSDAPSLAVSLHSANIDKRVHVYLGCDSANVKADIDKVVALAKLIDESADTQQWIGDPSRRADPHR